MSRPAVVCTGLTHSLGREEMRQRVLNGVTLAAHSGRAHAIVGPSGCGKSTLLYLLGLLDRPEGGKIEIVGSDVSTLDDAGATRFRNEHLGFVFQFHFLIKEFTAAENIMLPMRRLGTLEEEEMLERAHDLLRAVGLADKAGRRANHLSGGEQQRVAIARALANRPPVLLADEPTGNLDSANSARVFDLLRQLVEERQLCLILVTHNPEIADRCDEVLEMQDGRILRVGPPERRLLEETVPAA